MVVNYQEAVSVMEELKNSEPFKANQRLKLWRTIGKEKYVFYNTVLFKRR